jgi:hypothetical protein
MKRLQIMIDEDLDVALDRLAYETGEMLRRTSSNCGTCRIQNRYLFASGSIGPQTTEVGVLGKIPVQPDLGLILR